MSELEPSRFDLIYRRNMHLAKEAERAMQKQRKQLGTVVFKSRPPIDLRFKTGNSFKEKR